MQRLRHLIVPLFVGLLALSPAEAQNEVPPPPPYQDQVLGSPTAPLEIIEYASFSCPHCGYFHHEVWYMLNSEFIETGQVRFIIRPIITQPQQIAAAGAILATCAGEERYYDAVDLLFVEQENIFSTIRAQGNLLEIYNRIAGAVGVTPEEFQTCLQTPSHNQRIGQTLELAAQDNVDGTPSFLIRGQILKIDMVDGQPTPTWGGLPVILNGERLTGELDADNFRRIVLHFLNESDSDNQ